ncbi:MAG: ribosome maturation factor RimM [Actinomycetes bacterium]
MSGSDRVVVGRVGRPHGLDGAFFVEEASEDARWFALGAHLLSGDEKYSVTASRHGAGGRPVIRLDRSVSRGAALEVPFDALPATSEDEYYTFQLIGLEVVEEGGRSLGPVVSIAPGIANDSIELEGGTLLPLVGACVLDIDLEAGRILVAPGFFDPA